MCSGPSSLPCLPDVLPHPRNPRIRHERLGRAGAAVRKMGSAGAVSAGSWDQWDSLVSVILRSAGEGPLGNSIGCGVTALCSQIEDGKNQITQQTCRNVVGGLWGARRTL